MAILAGPSAFPSEQHECQDGTWNQTFDPGMTLRDWFAGQALAGLCANPELAKVMADGDKAVEETFASMSAEIADAMLAERAKGGAE